MNQPNTTSIDPNEIEKFSRIADEWWDTNGKFKPLHKINPVRIDYIKRILENSSNIPVFRNSSILDIGCGGGLLAEPLAQLGAKVTGIDPSEENIKTATVHANASNLPIEYQCTSAEELAASGRQFDIVLNMEVIEHVADVTAFMKASCSLVKPGGIMFLATLNRTLKSYALAIIGAEYVLKWLPKGTHQWDKFLKPSEINAYLEQNAMRIQDISGVTYNPLYDTWYQSKDITVNYMLTAFKPTAK